MLVTPLHRYVNSFVRLWVPVGVAQDLADRLVASEITGILNFAPIRLKVPEGISVSSVGFSRSLEQLALETSIDFC